MEGAVQLRVADGRRFAPPLNGGIVGQTDDAAGVATVDSTANRFDAPLQVGGAILDHRLVGKKWGFHDFVGLTTCDSVANAEVAFKRITAARSRGRQPAASRHEPTFARERVAFGCCNGWLDSRGRLSEVGADTSATGRPPRGTPASEGRSRAEGHRRG